MTMDPSGWTEEARLPLDAFLDRVEMGLLSAGVVRAMRATVIKTVEAHISQRFSRAKVGDDPRATEVKAALDEMGIAGAAPVNDIASGTPEWRGYAQSLMPRRSRAAFWGAVCIALSLLPMIAVLVFMLWVSPAGLKIEADFPRDRLHAQLGAGGQAATLFHATAPDGSFHATMSGTSPLGAFFSVFVPIVPPALAATLLGLFGAVQIIASRGRVKGMPAALFSMLFYPVLLAIISCWLIQV